MEKISWCRPNKFVILDNVSDGVAKSGKIQSKQRKHKLLS